MEVSLVTAAEVEEATEAAAEAAGGVLRGCGIGLRLRGVTEEEEGVLRCSSAVEEEEDEGCCC